MDKFKCQIVGISKDWKTGQAQITLQTDKNILKEVEQLQDIDLSCTLKKWHNTRSLDANAYMWQLLTKLSEVMESPVTKDELYQGYIRQYGKSVEYQIADKAVKTMMGVWNAYGLGWFAELIDEGTEPNTSIIRFYYGSSCYSTKRMSRLIDAVVQDCKACGIETKTPDELAKIKAGWNSGK